MNEEFSISQKIVLSLLLFLFVSFNMENLSFLEKIHKDIKKIESIMIKENIK